MTFTGIAGRDRPSTPLVAEDARLLIDDIDDGEEISNPPVITLHPPVRYPSRVEMLFAQAGRNALYYWYTLLDYATAAYYRVTHGRGA